MQPAVDLIYNSLRLPGVAEKFYDQLAPQLKAMKKNQTKKEDK